MMTSHKESTSMSMKKEVHTMEETSTSFSSQQAMMSSMMESSSFSSMAAEMKFETMSMSSMSSMASESYAMSSSSLTEMSSQIEGASFRAISKSASTPSLGQPYLLHHHWCTTIQYTNTRWWCRCMNHWSVTTIRQYLQDRQGVVTENHAYMY